MLPKMEAFGLALRARSHRIASKADEFSLLEAYVAQDSWRPWPRPFGMTQEDVVTVVETRASGGAAAQAFPRA